MAHVERQRDSLPDLQNEATVLPRWVPGLGFVVFVVFVLLIGLRATVWAPETEDVPRTAEGSRLGRGESGDPGSPAGSDTTASTRGSAPSPETISGAHGDSVHPARRE